MTLKARWMRLNTSTFLAHYGSWKTLTDVLSAQTVAIFCPHTQTPDYLTDMLLKMPIKNDFGGLGFIDLCTSRNSLRSENFRNLLLHCFCQKEIRYI